MLHAVVPFSVVFIMFQASTATAVTTTPLVTVEYSNISLLSMVTMAPTLMGLPATSGHQDVVLLPLLTPRHSRCVVGLVTMQQQQPPSQMPLQAYANYTIGPPQVGFILELSFPPFSIFVCLVSVLVYTFCFQEPCWMLYSPMRLNHWALHHRNPLELTHCRHMSNMAMVIGPHLVCRVAAPSTALSRGSFMLLLQLSQAIPTIWWGIQLWGLGRVT